MQRNDDREIIEAANHKIDVSIFTILTQVPRGRYDCYLVDNKRVRPVSEEVGDLPAGYLSPEEDAALSAMGESLAFPCTPSELVEWVKGTFGTFQLPFAFIEAVEAHAEAKARIDFGKNIETLLSTFPASLRDKAKQVPYFREILDNLNPEQREKILADRSSQHESSKEMEQIFVWWNLTMDASLWWQRGAIKPQEAAYLLCRYNPLNSQSGNPKTDMTDETGPSDYARLLRIFEDAHEVQPQHRSLENWLQLAQQSGLKYHSWINDWLKAASLEQRQQQSQKFEKVAKSVKFRTSPWWKTRHDLDDMVKTFLENDPAFYRHEKGQHVGKANKFKLADEVSKRINSIEKRDGRTNRIDAESIRAYLKPLKI